MRPSDDDLRRIKAAAVTVPSVTGGVGRSLAAKLPHQCDDAGKAAVRAVDATDDQMTMTQPERERRQPHTSKCHVCGSANLTPTGRPDNRGLETHHCDDCGAQFTAEAENA